MNELKFYSVSDRYIDFLRESEPNVYSNKIETRKHTRKYVGVVVMINDYHYYIPVSSPKATDYQIAGENKVIKKSIVPIFRIVIKNSMDEKELKGTLRISHMIPVPESELKEYREDDEEDAAYKDLMRDEIIFVRRHSDKIISNAELMYKQKMREDPSAGYVKAALDYKRLEQMCDHFQKVISINCSDQSGH